MPKEPKCTVEQLEAELVKLKLGGFKCSVIYIENEIRKRKGARGRKATNDSPKHKKWREASKRYREKQDKPEPKSLHYEPIDD